jgi:hypothetical protein
MKIKKNLSVVLFLGFLSLYAQETSSTGNLIQGGIEDGNKLVDAYISPLNKAIIFGLGQYNFAGFSEKRSFSLGIKTGFLIPPGADRTYHINNLGLETLEAENPADDEAQTVLGDSTSYVKIVSKKKDLFGNPLYSFKSPRGSGYPGVPLIYLDLNYATSEWSVSAGLVPFVTVPTTDLNVFLLKLNYNYNLAGVIWGNSQNRQWAVGGGISYFHGFSRLDVQPSGVTVNVSFSWNHS